MGVIRILVGLSLVLGVKSTVAFDHVIGIHLPFTYLPNVVDEEARVRT